MKSVGLKSFQDRGLSVDANETLLQCVATFDKHDRWHLIFEKFFNLPHKGVFHFRTLAYKCLREGNQNPVSFA